MRAPKRQESSPKPVAHPVTHPGVRTNEWEGEFTYWSATAEPLIAAGLARSEWLPGQPDCPNTCSLELGVDGRRVKFSRRPDQSYCVQVRKTEAEQEAWEKSGPGQQRRREQARYEVEFARRKEERELAALPSEAETYRKNLVEVSLSALAFIVDTMERCPSGYHFSESDKSAVVERARQIVTVLRNGSVRLNRTVRDDTIAKIKAKTAQADPQFSTMMQTIVAGASEARHD